jgi:tripartite-type tricarboxylate transporter receptor subunit TctC
MFTRLGHARLGLPAFFTAAALFVSSAAVAQTFPSQRVRIIVPFVAGGPADIIARIISQKLPESWSRQTVVENLPGGSTNAGTAAVARAPADGHTILAAVSSIVTNPSLFKNLKWDPVRDFAPVSLVAASPVVLVVHPSVPAHSVSELVALLKANPGRYSYASSGVGTMSHLAAELFKLSVGVDMAHVPFGGGSPALASALGGHTPILFATGLTANIKDGSLRALAVTSAKRTPALPGVPTFAEAGYPGLESVFIQGMLAPAGTPRPIIDQWHREIDRIVALADVKERLAAIGFEPVGSSPDEFDAWIKAELPRWARVIREAGIERIE